MPARTFNWTGDRVELAKAMWGRGESGDTIADELNKNLTLADAGPVTRNAVIGKMHRAGMSAGKPQRTASATRPAKALTRPQASREEMPEPPATPRSGLDAAGLAALDASVDALELDPPEAFALKQVGRAQGCTLLELRNETCRWPIGTPGQPGFHFCGGKAPGVDASEPYCGYHSRIAYAAPVARRDQRPRPR